MSGHSKWSQIKRQKHAGDQKRGLIFSKLSNAITLAVKQGGAITDPASNFHLRLMIDRAKEANMPKENIERAIERGTAAGIGSLEEILLEGYGPGGIAVLVEGATDNRLRTAQSVKMLFERSGGSIAGRGSVTYLFTKQGLITIAKDQHTSDDILTAIIEAGAVDAEESEGIISVYTEPTKAHQIKESLRKGQFKIKDVEIIFHPNTPIPITNTGLAEKIIEFTAVLEDCDDVQKVFTNAEISDAVLSNLAK